VFVAEAEVVTSKVGLASTIADNPVETGGRVDGGLSPPEGKPKTFMTLSKLVILSVNPSTSPVEHGGL
jgi:hypothetical protein